MNDYISSIKDQAIRTVQEWNDYVSKDNQDQIKRIILLRLGMDINIIENPRVFEKISQKMDAQLLNMGLKKRKDSVIHTNDIDNLVTALAARGWRPASDGGFTILANTNKYLNGKKRVQKDRVMTEHRKETRYHVDNISNNIVIDRLTVLRVNPCKEDEGIVVGNTRTCVDHRGVEVQKIESRAVYNSENAFNLRDYYNPTEKDLMKFVKQITRDGDEPIKSHNGFLKGKCLVFNRYEGENQGAGKLEFHSTGKDNKVKHQEPLPLDLTRMEGDIATLDFISLKNLEELEDYEYDPYDKRGKLYRMRRLDSKIEESKILGSIHESER